MNDKLMKMLNTSFSQGLVWIFVLFIAACSTPDNSEPPAELTEIIDAEALYEIWSIDTGKGANENFFDLQPLVMGNKIFTIDTRGIIHQIDAGNGRSDWEFATGLTSIAGLSGKATSLVATSSEGLIARFDIIDNGLRSRWQRSLNSEIRSRAIIHDSQVIVRTVDGKLSVLDANSGEVIWLVSRRVPALSLTGSSYPVVSGDLVISGFDNGKLVAFERTNGNTVWETPVGSPSGRTEIERLVDLDGQFILRNCLGGNKSQAGLFFPTFFQH